MSSQSFIVIPFHRAFTVAVLLLVGHAASGLGSIFYVATNGVDTNPGTNITIPFATLSTNAIPPGVPQRFYRSRLP